MSWHVSRLSFLPYFLPWAELSSLFPPSPPFPSLSTAAHFPYFHCSRLIYSKRSTQPNTYIGASASAPSTTTTTTTTTTTHCLNMKMLCLEIPYFAGDFVRGLWKPFFLQSFELFWKILWKKYGSATAPQNNQSCAHFRNTLVCIQVSPPSIMGRKKKFSLCAPPSRTYQSLFLGHLSPPTLTRPVLLDCWSLVGLSCERFELLLIKGTKYKTLWYKPGACQQMRQTDIWVTFQTVTRFNIKRNLMFSK